MIVSDSGGPVFLYMSEKIGLPWSTELRVIGEQRKDLSIAAGVAYNGWLEDSVFMHICIEPHGLTREFLREAFMFPFRSRSRVYGMTPITSHRALGFNKRVGFRELYRTPDFVLQVMTRDECRWINELIPSAPV